MVSFVTADLKTFSNHRGTGVVEDKNQMYLLLGG